MTLPEAGHTGGVATQERILSAAAALFATRGFSATSTRDLAAAVGISQPGLYNHFLSKDEVLRALYRRAMAPAAELAAAIAGVDAAADVGLYRYLHDISVHLHQSPQLLASLLRTRELGHPRFSDERRLGAEAEAFVESRVRQGVSDGSFRPVELRSAARFLFGLIDALASPTHPAPTDEDIDELLTFAFRGLLTDVERLPAVREAALGLHLDGVPVV